MFIVEMAFQFKHLPSNSKTVMSPTHLGTGYYFHTHTHTHTHTTHTHTQTHTTNTQTHRAHKNTHTHTHTPHTHTNTHTTHTLLEALQIFQCQLSKLTAKFHVNPTLKAVCSTISNLTCTAQSYYACQSNRSEPKIVCVKSKHAST